MIKKLIVEKKTVDLNNLKIKKTKESDSDELVFIRTDSMKESLIDIDKYEFDIIKDNLLDNLDFNQTYFINDGNINIGFYSLKIDDKKKITYIEHMYILTEYIGQGIGNFILKKIIDESKYPLELKTLKNSKANDFYKKNGFKKIDQNEWDNFYRYDKEIKESKKYLEYSITNKSTIAELLFNANANISEDKFKELINEYLQIQTYVNNGIKLNYSITQVNEFRKQLKDILDQLHHYNLRDIDNDGMILRLKQYVNSNVKNEKLIYLLKRLGFIDNNNNVTELGKWVGHQLQTNSQFSYLNILNDDELESYRKAFIQLKINREPLTQGSLKKYVDNEKLFDKLKKKI
jgi:N-acetylglutamate synthase-like GNAT family acetyltransferase